MKESGWADQRDMDGGQVVGEPPGQVDVGDGALRLAHYVGGPFEDRTGGLITFDADDAAQAQRAVRGDPVVLEGLIEAHWLKQWTPESNDPADAP